MWVADRRSAQFQGFGWAFAAAFAGKERREIGTGGEQGRKVVPGTPAAGVLRFGHPAVGVCGVAPAGQGAVGDQLIGLDRALVLGVHLGRWSTSGHQRA